MAGPQDSDLWCACPCGATGWRRSGTALAALSPLPGAEPASSPFWSGHDTGRIEPGESSLVGCRRSTARAQRLVRHGRCCGPGQLGASRKCGGMSRPRPHFSGIQIRMFDGVATLGRSAGRCAVREPRAPVRHAAGPWLPAAPAAVLVIRDNKWRATGTGWTPWLRRPRRRCVTSCMSSSRSCSRSRSAWVRGGTGCTHRGAGAGRLVMSGSVLWSPLTRTWWTRWSRSLPRIGFSAPVRTAMPDLDMQDELDRFSSPTGLS